LAAVAAEATLWRRVGLSSAQREAGLATQTECPANSDDRFLRLGNAKGGHSTFPSDDTISANRGGSDGLDLRAAGGSACEAWQGNLWDDGARGVFCHPAGVSCLGRVSSGGGAVLANGYFLPARRAESLACLMR